MLEVIGVIAIFAIVCRLYSFMTGRSVFKKRPRWDAEQEAVLENAQFASYRNRLTESHLPLIKGDYTDFHAVPFALDAEPSTWTDERRSA